MTDVIVLLVSALVSAVVFAVPARQSRWWRLASVPLWMLTLGLALRFCGRTYPGIFYPDSELLNALLNGVGLFTEIGYVLVLAFGVTDVLFVVLTRFGAAAGPTNVVRPLAAGRVALLVLILSIIAYGFYFAAVLQRLPGWTYQ